MDYAEFRVDSVMREAGAIPIHRPRDAKLPPVPRVQQPTLESPPLANQSGSKVVQPVPVIAPPQAQYRDDPKS